MKVSSLNGSFPVRHEAGISLLDNQTFVQMREFCKQCLKHHFKIRSHPSNWSQMKIQDLMVVISGLQSRGAPELSKKTVKAPLKYFETVSDGAFEPNVDTYVPNSVLIVPSLIPNAGLGVVARHRIPKETLLGSYQGTYIWKEKQMKIRTQEEDNRYVFSIYRADTNSKRFVLAIDASSLNNEFDSRQRLIKCQGSWPRFVNKSLIPEEANTEYRVFYPDLKKNKRDFQILIYALRDIEVGEELLAMYNDDELSDENQDQV